MECKRAGRGAVLLAGPVVMATNLILMHYLPSSLPNADLLKGLGTGIGISLMLLGLISAKQFQPNGHQRL